jgi:hypothetical protein
MRTRVTFDEGTFGRSVKRLTELTGKGMEEILREQAGLFAKDAMKFTPPFGNAPITESMATQLDVGTKSVSRDVSLAFQSVQHLRVAQQGSRPGKSILAMIQKGQIQELELVLRKMSIRAFGVEENATVDLLNRLRDRYGRVRRRVGSYLIINAQSIAAVLKHQLENLGIAKAGWGKALRATRKTKHGMPRWVTRHEKKTGGYYREGGTGQKFFVEVGNEVPYAQKFKDHIEQRAWVNRLRNIPKQVRQMEKALEKKTAALNA